MNRQVSVGELVDWIWDNRRCIVWKEYTKIKIFEEVNWCITYGSLCYSTDSKGALDGVTCGRLDHDKKVFYVINILCLKTEALKNMLNWLITLYPNYTLEGFARGTRKRYFNDPHKLLRRLH